MNWVKQNWNETTIMNKMSRGTGAVVCFSGYEKPAIGVTPGVILPLPTTHVKGGVGRICNYPNFFVAENWEVFRKRNS